MVAQAAELPPEPPAGPDATEIILRLPSGRVTRRFRHSETVQVSISFLHHAQPNLLTAYQLDHIQLPTLHPHHP
jgi:hypothetical protein